MKFQQSGLTNLRIMVCFVGACLMMPAAVLPAADGFSQSAPEEMVRKNLEPFAGAYKEVSELSSTYAQRIIQSEPDQADVLQEEANQKMTQAVTNHGLSVEDYNFIFHTIQSEPELQEEFMIALQRAQ
ncbi:DUF4168 domain-containing protein [Candidatus Nitrospira allomarina]|uniref:DUF4168 domain-containing protein n=1 Tax=Candidatus Nitrospira allomarina TaxID=3020900 RepID=A0AA96GF45_9BACT|nr:DUF4168 domain-containing protein [Candidatus Nitrospira allomarina]WNM60022.1 DUF4168 domain-containing protein [Candidatus Nitrospira allomarina]